MSFSKIFTHQSVHPIQVYKSNNCNMKCIEIPLLGAQHLDGHSRGCLYLALSSLFCRDRGLLVLHGGHRGWKLLQERLERFLVIYGDEDPGPGRPHDSDRNTRPCHLEWQKVVCSHPRAVHSSIGTPSRESLRTTNLTRR